jgi:hypothetical protein
MTDKKESAPKEHTPKPSDTRVTSFGKDVYMDGGKVVHVGSASTHPHLISAGTPVELSEKEIAAVEAALEPHDTDEGDAA